MTIIDMNQQKPTAGEVSLAYIIYGLHGFSALSGVLSPALVVTAFTMGWPSIIAVILTYMKRSDVKGTYLESHFRWTLRTFWFALLWILIGVIPFVTVIGIPVAMLIWIGAGLWVLYRIIRGLKRLLSEETMPV
jgi:uncharacterized membrane protein